MLSLSKHDILIMVDIRERLEGQAEACKESGTAKTILFNLSGHGLLDLGAYQSYLDGALG
jgi:predicted alternative tryptophan synthase beta-subunit